MRRSWRREGRGEVRFRWTGGQEGDGSLGGRRNGGVGFLRVGGFIGGTFSMGIWILTVCWGTAALSRFVV